MAAKSFVARSIVFFVALVSALATADCGINNIPTYEQSTKAAWSEVLKAALRFDPQPR
jgi:LemA protein